MEPEPSTVRIPSVLVALTLVAVTVMAAHFTRLSQLGLYEDDYWSIAPHLGEPLSKLRGLARGYFTEWPTGRPLNYLLPAALSAVGSRAGGLTGVYAIAAAWLALNGLLVYLAARRIGSEAGALVAAVAYLLYPADSTRLLLTHAAHVQGAMTFLLLGCWLWLLGGWRRALSYPVVALCLLSYESTFLPFLVLPLCVPIERTRLVRTWATHAGAIALVVGLDAAIRVAKRDVRALAAVGQPAESLRRVVTSLWLGPVTSVTSFFRGVKIGLESLDPLAVLAALVVTLVLLVALANARPEPKAERPGQDTGIFAARLPPWRVLVAALLTWSIAYALTLTNYPPTQEMSRLTSTHVAAAWPAALAFAALFDLLRGAGRWRGRVVTGVMVAWLAALVGYQHVLQRGYVRAWDEQRRFWKELTLRSPDVGPGWAVVVTGPPRDFNPVILSNSWSDYIVHRHIYGTEPGPEDVAFAHLGFVHEQVAFERNGEAWRWRPEFWWGGPWLSIDPTRLALFEDDHGELRRVEEVKTPAGTLRSTAPMPTTMRTSWPSTHVSRLLFPEVFPIQ
jgi:hypothetical protein